MLLGSFLPQFPACGCRGPPAADGDLQPCLRSGLESVLLQRSFQLQHRCRHLPEDAAASDDLRDGRQDHLRLQTALKVLELVLCPSGAGGAEGGSCSLSVHKPGGGEVADAAELPGWSNQAHIL